MTCSTNTLKWLSSLVLMLSLLSGILVLDRKADARGSENGSASVGTTNHTSEYPALAAYATDLTKLANEGKLDAVTDHDKEILQMVKILCRETRNNPVLISEPGFGRNIVVAGLAHRMASGDVPASLMSKRLFSLNMNVLSQGANSSTDVQSRLNSVLAEVKLSQGQILLFVDELPQFMANGETKPVLSTALSEAVTRGDLNVIGATTRDGYESISGNPRMAGLFDSVVIGNVTEVAAVDDQQGKSDSDSFVGDKVSPDLREMIQNGASDKVSAILQVDDAQQALLRQLLRQNSVNVSQHMGSALAVELPLKAVENLTASGLVFHISRDRNIISLGHVSQETGTDAATAQPYSSISKLDGTGVGIAIVDSGIDSGHSSFLNSAGTASRVIYSKNFVTTETTTNDLYGHGTHVAGLAAGNGIVQAGAYRGVAPDANLINLRVLDGQGQGKTSYLLAALDWLAVNYKTYNIRVVNLSLGAPALESYSNDPVCKAVRKLHDLGIVVVAAAGNNGKNTLGQKVYGQIHSPGNEPTAITVGAANSFGTSARADDGVATYSSRGPTRSYWTTSGGIKHYDNVIKPDLVALGNKLISSKPSAGCLLTTQHPELNAYNGPGSADAFFYLSGTSMSAPIVAGAAALLFEVNPNLTPSLAKALLQYTATPIKGYSVIEQGAGQLNVAGAAKLADLVRRDLTSTTTVGSSLLTATAPAPQTSLDVTYTWAQGVTFDFTSGTGVELITKVQGGYLPGQRIGNGVIVSSNGTLVRDSAQLTAGITLARNIVISNGGVLGTGTTIAAALRGSGVIVSDGVLINDGVLVADGVLISDGVLVSDGVLIGDGVLVSDSIDKASVLSNGDNTACM